MNSHSTTGTNFAAQLRSIAPATLPTRVSFSNFQIRSSGLLAALALACSDLRRLPYGNWLAWGIPAASVAVFAFFFPILAALPLSGGDDYLIWAWLKGWR